MPIAPSRKSVLPAPVYDRDGITLYVGDARGILPTLPAGSVDLVFTDPPFGHNNNDGDLIHNREKALGESRKKWHGRDSVTEQSQNPARPIANDSPEDANALVRWFFAEADRLLDSGCCCCCGGGGPDPQFARWSMWLDEAIGFKQMVVWDKGPMGMGWHYRRSYEVVLVGQKPGAACRWYDTSSKIENIIRPGYLGIRKIIPQGDQHPTEKPVELAEFFIRLHSQKGHIVLDPFLGSGSTALAAKKWGRMFIGIDLDRDHVDATIDRLENAEGGGVLMDLRKQMKKRGSFSGRTRA